MDLNLVTSRYHSPLVKQAIEERGLVAIGITVGSARFLQYELAASLGALAPHGLMKLGGDEFDRAYQQRLDSFGVDAIRQMVVSVGTAYKANGAILLCFEKVELGEACHRRTFAAWWERETGQVVHELTPAQLPLA